MPRTLPPRGGTDWQRAQQVAVDATALKHRRGIMALRYWRWWAGLAVLVVGALWVVPWLSDHAANLGFPALVLFIAAGLVVAFGRLGSGRGYRQPRELRRRRH